MTTMALTYKGAAFDVELKTSPIVAGSSAELEGLGLLKVANRAKYARIVLSKLGVDTSRPTTILCDAEAALRAASGESSVNRMKHSLRRSAIVRERVLDGDIELAHVPDAANAVDIFTKWVPAEKLEACLSYLTGGSSRGVYGAVVGRMVAMLERVLGWMAGT